MTLLQAAGLTRESWAWNERILALAPLSKPYLVVRALKLWLLGKVAAADKVIDRVRGVWPLDQFGYFVRFLLFSLTGRTDAALAMLASNPKLIGSSDEVALWRAALPALDDPSPKALATAREACVNVARKVPWITNDAVMILCALNQIEEAFDLTDGYLLWRGKVISADQANGRVVNDYSRRMTQWLFSPPAAAMRSDPRFLQLCNEFGLVAYWNARHVKPDYLVYG